MEILVVGATGYIGGTILSHLAGNPNYRLTAVVRLPEDARSIETHHSSLVRVITAEYFTHETLFEAATLADVVVYACRNTQDGIDALMQGLALRSRRGPANANTDTNMKKGIFIMLSAIISLVNPRELALGELSGRVFSDVDDAKEIMTLPTTNWHVTQEQEFLRKGRDCQVTSVILSLPFALGNGTGAVRRMSFVHQFVKATAEMGKRFVLGRGHNRWSWCSVHDIARAVGFLVSRIRTSANPDPNQYFYLSAGDFTVRDEAVAIGKIAGLPCENDVLELDYEQFKEVMPELPALWGVSCRVKADRLRSAGWEAEDKDWTALLNDAWVLVASHSQAAVKNNPDAGIRNISGLRASSASTII